MSTHEGQGRAGTPLHHAETTDHIDPDNNPDARSGDPEGPADTRAPGGPAAPGGDLHHRETTDHIDPTGRT